jgi:hypothetical protein
MWAVLHEVRSEYAQALVVAFLPINGPRQMVDGRALRQGERIKLRV